MVISIFLFLVISSGSIFAAVRYQKKYEELLPVTIFSIIIVLYLCGLLGILKTGVYIICFASLSLYVMTAYLLIKEKKTNEFKRNILTTGFFVFIILFILLAFIDYKMVAHSWDEFSHWATVVKEMWYFNDLSTNAQSTDYFNFYPPAMALFQYFATSIGSTLSSNGVFMEWLMYFCYQISCISLFMPFLKNRNKLNVFSIILTAIGCFSILIILSSDAYQVLLIDLFLGLLAGFGFFSLFLLKDDSFSVVYILFAACLLPLTKDIGLFFALFLVAGFLVDILFFGEFRRKFVENKKIIEVTLLSILVILLPLLAKYSWDWHLKIAGLKGIWDTSQINILDMLITKDLGYRHTVMMNYIHAFFDSSKITIGSLGINLSFCWLTIILYAGMTFIYIAERRRNPEKKGRTLIFCIGVASIIPIYLIIQLVFFMFLFTEYEAVQLGGYVRYLMVAYSILIIIEYLYLLHFVEFAKHKKAISIISMIILLIALPFNQVINTLDRQNVKNAIKIRSGYDQYANACLNHIDKEKANIYIVAQETIGFDYWVLRYNISPNISNGLFTWSIGEPFYEGDVWTKTINPKEWQQELLKSYDYVMIYKVNEYFIDNFSPLFSDSMITEKAFYKVNKENGMLDTATKYIFKELSNWDYEVKTENEWLRYADLNEYYSEYGERVYHLTFDLKVEKPGPIIIYMQNGSGSRYETPYETIEATTEYKTYDVYLKPFLLNENLNESWLAFYGQYGSGVIPSVKNVKLEVVLW